MGKLSGANGSGKRISRRDFIKAGSASVAAIGFPFIVSSSALGKDGAVAASERIALGCIGVGGQGFFNMKSFITNPAVQVVAVCDVNEESDYSKFYFGGTAGRKPVKAFAEQYYADKSGGSFKGVDGYVDYQDLIGRKDIDAVVIATPDHWHTLMSVAAMRLGKHVYCEKPISHSVHEARWIAEEAKKAGVVTQMGNQGHAEEGVRLLCEWFADGAIGDVHTVHIWCNRPGGMWAQGVDRPSDTPAVPKGLEWDKWIGPAKFRSYHSAYHPFEWRGWWDFGTGSLGDMGCHQMDAPYWALKLDAPVSIEASSTKLNDETAPLATKIHYKFGKRGDMCPVEMIWYDGGLKPARPVELEEGRELKSEGLLFVGDKGTILSEFNGGSPRIIPESKMREYKRPAKTIERSIGHREEFIAACQGKDKACSNFEYAGPLNEIVLLGNVAVRASEKLLWDSKNLKFSNCEAANKYIRDEYRQGYGIL